jgi:hypothetical protein
MTSLSRRNLQEQQPLEDDGLFYGTVNVRRDHEAETEAALKRIDEALAKARPRIIEQRSAAMKTLADIFDEAADLIEPEGAWVRHTAGDRRTCFCMASAIGVAAGNIDGPNDYFYLARDMVSKVVPESVTPMVDFNDAPGRTQAEVVAKLREAAAKAREQGL